MARFPALVAALSEVDGRDANVLANIARTVREAGLISTTKRGVGASEMTALDAARLLLGFASDSAAAAPATAERFSELLPQSGNSREAGDAFETVRSAARLDQAVAALIEVAPKYLAAGAASLAVAQRAKEAAAALVANGGGPYRFRLSLIDGWRARISVTEQTSGRELEELNFIAHVDKVFDAKFLPKGDRGITVTFTERTLLALYGALQGLSAVDALSALLPLRDRVEA